MDRNGLLAALLIHLVTMVTEEATYGNRVLYGWIYSVVSKSEEWTSPLPYRQLLEITAQTVNQSAPPILYLLIELVDEKLVSSEKKAALKCELEMYYGQHADTSEHEQTTRESGEEFVNETPSEKKQKWSKCVEKVHWSNYPLGLLPNQSLSYKNLELDRSELDEEEELESDDGKEDSTEEMEIIDTDSDTESPDLEKCVWSEETVQIIAHQIVLF